MENETIVYSTPEKTLWRLPIAEVRVIGEFTTANGPYVDDYFFLFVTTDVSKWYCSSFYAIGRDKFLTELGQKLGHKLECGLCNSTKFKSRIMWPPNLEGHSVFESVPETPATNFLGKVRQKFLPKVQNQLTGEIRETIGV